MAAAKARSSKKFGNKFRKCIKDHLHDFYQRGYDILRNPLIKKVFTNTELDRIEAQKSKEGIIDELSDIISHWGAERFESLCLSISISVGGFKELAERLENARDKYGGPRMRRKVKKEMQNGDEELGKPSDINQEQLEKERQENIHLKQQIDSLTETIEMKNSERQKAEEQLQKLIEETQKQLREMAEEQQRMRQHIDDLENRIALSKEQKAAAECQQRIDENRELLEEDGHAQTQNQSENQSETNEEQYEQKRLVNVHLIQQIDELTRTIEMLISEKQKAEEELQKHIEDTDELIKNDEEARKKLQEQIDALTMTIDLLCAEREELKQKLSLNYQTVEDVLANTELEEDNKETEEANEKSETSPYMETKSTEEEIQMETQSTEEEKSTTLEEVKNSSEESERDSTAKGSEEFKEPTYTDNSKESEESTEETITRTSRHSGSKRRHVRNRHHYRGVIERQHEVTPRENYVERKPKESKICILS